MQYLASACFFGRSQTSRATTQCRRPRRLLVLPPLPTILLARLSLDTHDTRFRFPSACQLSCLAPTLSILLCYYVAKPKNRSWRERRGTKESPIETGSPCVMESV